METAALLGSASMQSTPGTVSKRRLMEDEESTIGLFDHAQIAVRAFSHPCPFDGRQSLPLALSSLLSSCLIVCTHTVPPASAHLDRRLGA